VTAGALIALGLAAAAASFVLMPLLRRDDGSQDGVAAAGEIQDLQSRHDMALGALKDLADDRATGKIDDVDYAALEAKLTAQALQTMKELDAHARTHPSIAKRRRAEKP
jgi:hypothetical protein